MASKFDEIKRSLADYENSRGHASLSWQRVAENTLLENAPDFLRTLLAVAASAAELEPFYRDGGIEWELENKDRQKVVAKLLEALKALD